MTAQPESNAREVSVVKRFTNKDFEDSFSIHLKSSDDSIDELLQTAMNASSSRSQEKSDKKPGIE